jgi:hypothetical protein
VKHLFDNPPKPPKSARFGRMGSRSRSRGHKCILAQNGADCGALSRPNGQGPGCEWIEDNSKRSACIESSMGLKSKLGSTGGATLATRRSPKKSAA